jgi:acyl-coenzyme A thioesterase PaaI-like protein
LKLRWYNDRNNDPERVIAHVKVPEDYNGYPGVVHGGIVAAMLDETAGRAALLTDNERLLVTLKLETAYRQPTPTNTELTVTGWIVQDRGSRVKVAGEIRLPDGTLTASCSALLVQPPHEVTESFEAERKYWYVDGA